VEIIRACRPETVVVRLEEQRGEHYARMRRRHVIVELDAPLGYSDMLVPEPMSGRYRAGRCRFLVHAANSSSGFWADGDRPLATR